MVAVKFSWLILSVFLCLNCCVCLFSSVRLIHHFFGIYFCILNRQPEVAARKLGINSSFIKGDYCYVLVRVSRFRETARLMKPIPPNQMLHEDVSDKIQNMTPGNSTETIQFMTSFGTHYINSYVTGNSLYQVRISNIYFYFYFYVAAVIITIVVFYMYIYNSPWMKNTQHKK